MLFNAIAVPSIFSFVVESSTKYKDAEISSLIMSNLLEKALLKRFKPKYLINTFISKFLNQFTVVGVIARGL